ncbi:hypothetical protein B0A49_09644 [Cryomyces minteri]|uniref:Adenylyltransferase and sulfurtransferase uba4 n=1 Tax=Cryomyces minteri TaxID=331657 RepID=A0A4U0WNL8_9PEZI|nr:hypothetical protein B0A49_13136 [Cryomyces minteri]TKA64053.1 hypothetical protein B0A49_09644 [Cryomyces minteri]
MSPTEDVDAYVLRLRRQVRAAEVQLRDLRRQLVQAEKQADEARNLNKNHDRGLPFAQQSKRLAVLRNIGQEQGYEGHTNGTEDRSQYARSKRRWPLRKEEYKRYGRQLIMPEIALEGQLRLRSCSVLVVGVGGLGCPAALYLAGAGVSTVGLVDGDTVEESNLHRQILHSTEKIGMSKVDSAAEQLRSLNPLVNYVSHREHLTPQIALQMFDRYDLVLDCTDHPTSRYLISDTCVLLQKPLVSASALRTEGQLMVLNNPPRAAGDVTGGPCYRCVFPRPPPAESVTSCGEGGILGPVVGVMGVLQALEAIKIIVAGIPKPFDADRNIDISTVGREEASDASAPTQDPPSLLLFSAYTSPPFRSVRLRSRRKDCMACSASATITRASLTSGSLDYAQFCGVVNPVSVLEKDSRISANDYDAQQSMLEWFRQTRGSEVYGAMTDTIVDVREKVQFDLCHFDRAINVPWSEILADDEPLKRALEDLSARRQITVVCRLGNDSQLAVRKIRELRRRGGAIGSVETDDSLVMDIEGGLRAWTRDVDPEFPEY